MDHPSLLDRINLGLGAAALVACLALLLLTLANRRTQQQLQAHQLQINNGRVTQQVTSNVIRDLAPLALRDNEIAALLKKYGFELKAGGSQ